MIALEDGYIKLDDTVETKDGYHIMHGAAMIDHNRNRGGYGTITLEMHLSIHQILEFLVP